MLIYSMPENETDDRPEESKEKSKLDWFTTPNFIIGFVIALTYMFYQFTTMPNPPRGGWAIIYPVVAAFIAVYAIKKIYLSFWDSSPRTESDAS